MRTNEAIKEEILKINNPITGELIGKCGEQVVVESNETIINVTIIVGYPMKSMEQRLSATVVDQLTKSDDGRPVSLAIELRVVAHSAQSGLKLLPNVRNVIAIASGKGGVGKSTTTTNLALALASEGARVGVLDADIYGPSQQVMLGLKGRPESADGKSITPMESHGIQAMSIGALVDVDQPMVWRGPMVSQALEQLLRDTMWSNLDYLLIDLPPGTGDIQLTLSQKVPLTGVVIVTTPQDIALIDAKKALKMFEKVHVPILGIIENMSVHICSQCGHSEHIFGQGGGDEMSKDYEIDVLGALPLDIKIREALDAGKPTLISDPDGPASATYRDIARSVGLKLARRKRDYSQTFPKIKVENN
ncbi:MAG: iron-sulfur cluster carrier protein ApbC [Proteobacteria bacterium]|nr:iron-sulfur cluster carrier protein ApbC [Pseudomonadota bacterium]MDA0861491.1 iron-sulfur cluster carrier protein ApbC [Pseudomonadota bacterium]MDA1031188.1 iron-sulfur cluster carrier protein ApbC [Pseudomonadota bacterium]